MKIENPKVTLLDEARVGVKEEVRSGFLDWLHEFVVDGDDGNYYELGGSILSMNVEKLDVATLVVHTGKGSVRQLKHSIYKVAEFPEVIVNKFIHNPAGTLKISKKEHSVLIECGKEYSVECFEDNSWHLLLDSGDGVYKADLWHKPHGFPLWYGREKPSHLTQHSITYGYNFAGDVEGKIILNGKNINVKGTGVRERYVAVDSSAAELGGWEDWGYITFNEMHSSMYDMRLGMKDFSLYDLETKKHYPEGKMEITHEDWVYLRKLDGFIPSIYNIKIEVSDGVYEVKAYLRNARVFGVTYKVPSYPVAQLVFDKVEGKFTFKDGKIKVLTNGRGAMSIRQFHAYPNILPRELFMDDQLVDDTKDKFETL